MTDRSDNHLSGEQKLTERRRKFWRYLALVMLAALIAGLLSGWMIEAHERGEIAIWVPLTAGFATIVGLIWFTYDYFQRVDELDLMDNLWSHLIGLYGGVFAFGAWYLFADLKLTPEPTAIGVVLAMLISTFLAYFARKLGWR